MDNDNKFLATIVTITTMCSTITLVIGFNYYNATNREAEIDRRLADGPTAAAIQAGEE